MWFLARWMSTYLMIPEETGDKISKNALISFYGENNQGKVLLDLIVRISSSTFVSYPGEKDLQVHISNLFQFLSLPVAGVCSAIHPFFP